MEGGGAVVVAFWTLKMVYLVPTQYFLIELQLINHFFNSLTNEKESVTKECNHAQQHHSFRVSFTTEIARSLLAVLAAV